MVLVLTLVGRIIKPLHWFYPLVKEKTYVDHRYIFWLILSPIFSYVNEKTLTHPTMQTVLRYTVFPCIVSEETSFSLDLRGGNYSREEIIWGRKLVVYRNPYA